MLTCIVCWGLGHQYTAYFLSMATLVTRPCISEAFLLVLGLIFFKKKVLLFHEIFLMRPPWCYRAP